MWATLLRRQDLKLLVTHVTAACPLLTQAYNPIAPRKPCFHTTSHNTRYILVHTATGDCLRIRLVVQLLEACAEYFVVGQSRARLDKFLAYFQRYLFCKPGLPP